MENKSNVYNLSGKTLTVDEINILGSEGSSDSLTAIRRAKGLVSQKATAESLFRLGARKDETENNVLYLYSFNMGQTYSTDWDAAYYVPTSYVSYNGAKLAVNTAIGTVRYLSFVLPINDAAYYGTWLIGLVKAAEDEAYTPKPVFLSISEASSEATVIFTDLSGNTYSTSEIIAIGTFTYDTAGIYDLSINQSASDALVYVRERFMQILSDAQGSVDSEVASWFKAMKVDQFFKRLAVYELFVDGLFANNISSSNFQEDEDGFYAIKGFKLQSQQDSLLGLIRSADARFYNVDVKGGTLEDCTIVKKAEGTDYTIFETQDIIPSISFSASERGGSYILEGALTGGQVNGNNLSLITAPTSWSIYKSYEEAQTSSDTTKVYYSDYSFTAGFTGTYTFYTPAVGSNDHFRVTISVGGNSYITQYATDGSYDTIKSVDVPVTKGQTVSVHFSSTTKIYSRSDGITFAFLGVLFAQIQIKTWLNEYTGSYSSFTKGSKYWVALEYVSASDLNVRSPILPQSSSPLLASTLDDMGVRALRAGTLYKPSEIAYYNLDASEDAYNAFASLPTNRTARLSTATQIRYANTFYSITRVRRTDSNLIFYDDNGSVLSIPKSTNYGHSFPACSTLQLEYGITAPFLYTQTNGLGQIGTQDIQYAKAYIQNIYGALAGNVTGNVNYSGDTSHQVWSAVFN